MKSIDVFVRIDRQQDLSLIKVFGQGQLNENAVDFRVVVHLFNKSQQLLLRGFSRQAVIIGINPYFLTCTLFGSNIGF